MKDAPDRLQMVARGPDTVGLALSLMRPRQYLLDLPLQNSNSPTVAL